MAEEPERKRVCREVQAVLRARNLQALRERNAETERTYQPPSTYFQGASKTSKCTLDSLGFCKVDFPWRPDGWGGGCYKHDEWHPVVKRINEHLLRNFEAARDQLEQLEQLAQPNREQLEQMSRLSLNQLKQLSRKQVQTAFQLLGQRPGLVAAWDVGLGKTWLAVLTAALLIWEGQVQRAVFVVPKSVKKNFESALEEIGFAELLWDLEGAQAQVKNFVRVCTIDELQKEHPDLLVPDQARREAARLCALEVFRGALLVVDEAHNFRTYPTMTENTCKGSKTVMMMVLSRLAEKRLLLTATPVPNNPTDMITLALIAEGGRELVRKDMFTHFLDVQMDGGHVFFQKKPREREERFCAIFKGLVTFLSRKDPEAQVPCASAFTDNLHTENGQFPRVVRETVEIAMTAEQAATYYQGLADMKTAAQDKAAVSENKRFAVNAFYHQERAQSNLTDRLKVDEIVRCILTLPVAARCMVYSTYKDMGVRLVRDRLQAAGISYAYIDGGTSKEQRDQAVDLINTSKVRVIILSRAGGEGLDLQAVTHVYLLEPSWNKATQVQAEGRAVRRGALRHLPLEQRVVTVYRLTVTLPNGDPTGDDLVRSISESKTPCIKAFTDNLQAKCDPLKFTQRRQEAT
jgi:superfamily II DNA or RNA helicase